MKSPLRYFIPFLLPVGLLVGCSTIPRGVAGSNVVAPGPLKLAIGYDVGFLRADLRRAKHLVLRFILEPDSSGVLKPQPEPIKVDNPYHLLVVSLGNGLILDYNGNLGIDLLRLYHLDAASSFDIVERFSGLFPAGLSLVKSGPRIKRKGLGITRGHLTAVIGPRIVRLIGEPFRPHMRIVRGADSLSLQPAGRPTWSSVTIAQPAPNTAIFPEIGGATTFRLLDSDHIRSTNGLDITRVGNRIEIVLHSPGGVEASFVYSKTENGCVVTSSDGYPTVRVWRSGRTIYVTSGSFLAATVTILSVHG